MSHHQSADDPPGQDDSLDEVSSIDPMDLYPLDEVSGLLGDIADYIVDELKSDVQDMGRAR